jgi:putative transposase
MRTAYQYRLRLTRQQQATVDSWLELARRQYNYRLAERFNWYEQYRCDIDTKSYRLTPCKMSLHG